MEEKLAHKDEECEALKNIVIAAQKDGNINGLISAADSNLLLSKVISLNGFWVGVLIRNNAWLSWNIVMHTILLTNSTSPSVRSVRTPASV